MNLIGYAMLKFNWRFVLVWFSLISLSQAAPPVPTSQIRVITSEFPPYSFSAGDQAEGVAVEWVESLLDEMSLNIKIEVYPWARAYEVAQREPNTLLFLVARTPEREALFHWVGQLMLFDVKVFRRTERSEINIRTLSDMKSFKVGSLIKDVKGAYLQHNGVQTIEYASEDSGIRMLNKGYIDLMPAELNSFRYRVGKLGYQQEDFEIAYELSEISKPLYLAFSLGTPETIVAEFQAALKKLPLDQILMR